MQKATTKAPLYQVGDCVLVPRTSMKSPAVVVEDRGCLGIQGRRLYGLLIPELYAEPLYTERAEEELEAISLENRPKWLKPEAFLDYWYLWRQGEDPPWDALTKPVGE